MEFFGPTNSNASDRMSDTVSAEPRDVLTVSDADLPRRSNTDRSGDEILMPDIYADAHVDFEPNLKALDHPTSDIDEPDGFNPYDTGVLQKKSDSKPRST